MKTLPYNSFEFPEYTLRLFIEPFHVVVAQADRDSLEVISEKKGNCLIQFIKIFIMHPCKMISDHEKLLYSAW